MRFVNFFQRKDGEGGRRPGLLVGDHVVDLHAEDRSIRTVMDVLSRRDELADQLERAAEHGAVRHRLSEVELLAPVEPRKFFGIGLNYADHVKEAGYETPTNLTVFAKAVSSVTGPYAPVARPESSEMLDYEGELGVVIGKRCRHVKAADAPSVIGGYLVVNDFSVRDWQTMTPQWSLGKSFDTHGPIGPWVTTEQIVGNPHDLQLRTYVNDELRQASNTSQLIFDCFRQVEILSAVCTLEPGDVIATGTPSGVAAAMDGKPWLKPGDVVRVEIEKLGSIENTVVLEQDLLGSAQPEDSR